MVSDPFKCCFFFLGDELEGDSGRICNRFAVSLILCFRFSIWLC